jgi:hypothetical protein
LFRDTPHRPARGRRALAPADERHLRRHHREELDVRIQRKARHVDHRADDVRLGGEIIRDVNDDPRLRKVAADRLLKKVIHTDGGPLMYHGSEEEQLSFDSTCRTLYRFVHQHQG